MNPKLRAAVAGITSAAVALGLAEVVAVFVAARSAPIVAVGGTIIDHVPEGGKEFAIRLFGTHDKTALLAGTAILLAAFAVLVGIAARRRWAYGVAGIAVFAAIGVAAAVTRPGASATWALPTLIGSAAALGVLWLLTRQVARAEDPDVPDREYQRRLFLRYTGLSAVGAVVAGFIGRSLASRRSVSQARAAVALPAPVSPAPNLPSDVDPGYVTTNDDFYRIDTEFVVVPQVDPATWKLRIHGMVDREVVVTYDELMAMPMIERYVTIACVSNEVGGDLIGNARWLGVPVKSLLDRAGPAAGADQTVQRSVDGWTCGTPTSVLRDGRDAMLAVGMNGVPLPIEHGFPVRMIVPGLYGYVSACKWISELELTTFAAFDAYWVPRGWAQQAPIKTESRIDSPRPGKAKAAGNTTISGVAWAQHRGVAKVEVRIDGGAWQEAQLLGTVSTDTWRQWRLSWAATPGRHTISCRATDANGDTQTETPAPPAPDGATGWHTITVSVT